MTRADRSETTSTVAEAAEAAETTLESFVAQLHSEGVEAGRKEAEEVIRAAEAEAEEIVRRARGEAEALVAEAQAEAEAAGERGRAELELAVRDAILQLQASLNAILRSLLDRAVTDQLSDPDELKPLLQEVVKAYARADAEAGPTEFRVPARAARTLEAWWSRELATAVAGAGAGVPALSGSLSEAGFEYDVGGGTVEVSVESVVEKLMELVRPGLRGVVEEVAKDAAAGAVPTASAAPGLAGVAERTGA
ncbi:MAG: hypothetical protein R6U63_10165 [Longimicrobiales bacterium]